GQAIYRGVSYADRAEALAAMREDELNTMFPWIVRTPAPLAMIVLAMAFGFLGGSARIVKEMTLAGQRFDGLRTWLTAHHGAAVGLPLLGLSVLVPAALAPGIKTVRPVALLFLCFFGGMFSDHFDAWLLAQISRIFPIKPRGGRK